MSTNPPQPINPRKLEQRRKALQMSKAALARRSGVSLTTVNRVLGGHLNEATFSNVVAILAALGMSVTANANTAAEEFREAVAQTKAENIVRMVQANCGLEGQAVDNETARDVARQTKQGFLRSNRRLWAT